MIKAIIVDDEVHCSERLISLLSNHSKAIKIVRICHTLEEAKNTIKKLNFDLVFLDIQLSDKTAFDLLKTIKNLTFQIIFTTAYDKYAIEAIKFSAFDYLLKPIDKDELNETLKRLDKTLDINNAHKLNTLLHNTLTEDKKKIVITTEKETYFLEMSNILRCEADGSYTKLYLVSNDTIYTSKTLKYYDDLLNSYHFFRTHQSHLININFISKYIKGTNAYIIMNDESVVPVAKRRKDDFSDKINNLNKFA